MIEPDEQEPLTVAVTLHRTDRGWQARCKIDTDPAGDCVFHVHTDGGNDSQLDAMTDLAQALADTLAPMMADRTRMARTFKSGPRCPDS